MRMLDKLRLRLRSVFRRRTVERELAHELSFHLDQLTEENIATGMPPDEARMAALRSIGGIPHPGGMPGHAPDEHHRRLLEGSPARCSRAATKSGLHDRRSPNIGARHRRYGCDLQRCLRSIAEAFAVSKPERLVGLYHRGLAIDSVMNQGAATYFTYLDNQRSFEGIGGWDRQEVSITGSGKPERVEACSP